MRPRSTMLPVDHVAQSNLFPWLAFDFVSRVPKLRAMRLGCGCPVGLILVIGLAAAGCGAQPIDPAFPVSTTWARQDLARMAANPKPLERPLVVISGFLDPGLAATSMHDQFARVTGDKRIAMISLFECMSFEQCRQKIVDVVSRAFPAATRCKRRKSMSSASLWVAWRRGWRQTRRNRKIGGCASAAFLRLIHPTRERFEPPNSPCSIRCKRTCGRGRQC